MMLVVDFLKDYQDKKIQNSKINENAVSEYLNKTLEIKKYIPFTTKRGAVEIVVAQNTYWEDGIKRHDTFDAYIGFVVSMLSIHTNLEFSDQPIEDYDLLAESGLLPQIIAEFQESYDECNVLLKMARDAELEDNNINVVVGRFLNGILDRLDSVGETLKEKLGNVNVADILGDKFNEKDLAKLKGFLDKYNK